MPRIRRACLALSILLVTAAAAHAAAGWRYEDYPRWTHLTWSGCKLFDERIDFAKIDYPRLHAAMFYACNKARAGEGLKPLAFHRALETAAWHHSRHMQEKAFFAHENPHETDRAKPADRARLAGIANPFIAENIAYNFAIEYEGGRSVYPRDREKGLFSYTADGPLIPPHTYRSYALAVTLQWMNSPGHRKNILSTSGLQLGCGAWFYRDPKFFNMGRFMATQNFQWFKPVEDGTAKDKGPALADGGGSKDSTDTDDSGKSDDSKKNDDNDDADDGDNGDKKDGDDGKDEFNIDIFEE